MSDTFFKNIHISNFKSLKDVTLSDCKRINLLIGKPNVGKSNILEAIGLFSLLYIKQNKSKKITQLIRLENLAELFFDGDIDKKINVKADDGSFFNLFYSKEFGIQFEINLEKNADYADILENALRTFLPSFSTNIKRIGSINEKFNITGKKLERVFSKVKYYKFPHSFVSTYDYILNTYLIPPAGNNLIGIILKNKELTKDLVALFSEYGLKLLFDKGSNSLRIMKETKDGEIFSIPYSSIADTLQRVIFFKTAIASNKDSILLFEEPEAHCFPPYIAHFTQDVLDSETNQFFIATHSPYVLNDFLENQRDEVAIFIADFKDGQTFINRLTDDEVDEVYNDGIDVFFNYERYTQHG